MAKRNKKKLSKKKHTLLWVIIVLAIFIASLYVLIRNIPTEIQKNSFLPTDTPHPSDMKPSYYDYSKYKLTSQPNLTLTENWETYKNPKFNFEVKYPPNWGISHNTYNFPQRALITFYSNNPYKAGASFSIGNPIPYEKGVDAWYAEATRGLTSPPDKLETEIINGLEFKKKFSAGALCGTNYYLSRDGYIFEFNLSTFCDEKTKKLNDQDLVNMLNTFKFIR